MPVPSAGYIERAVERLAMACRAILQAILQRREDEAIELIRQACQQGLGMDYDTLCQFDPHDTAALLGASDKVIAFARLVVLHARAQPQTAHRQRLCRYAMDLLTSALARRSSVVDPLKQEIAALLHPTAVTPWRSSLFPESLRALR